MTNAYYNTNFDPSVGSSVKSASLEAQFDAIEDGFDLIGLALEDIGGLDGFTSLPDVPPSYAGQALKYLQVNAAETAIQFVGGGKLNIVSTGATSLTLTAAHAGSLIIFTSASAVTVTVPGSVLSQGDVVCICQGAAGQVTMVGSGATFLSSEDLLKTRTQGAQIALIGHNGTPTGADTTVFGLIGERNAATLGLAYLAVANIFTKAQTVTPVALSDATNIATDASLSNTFTVTLAGNRTLDNPTNLSNGVLLTWRVTQDGTGSRTLAYGSKFKWAGGSAPVLTTTASATDLIAAQYFSDTDTLLCNCLKGFA